MSSEAMVDKSNMRDQSGRRLGAVIGAISHRLSADRIGTGPLAELRRISESDLPPAFWKLYLMDRVVPPEWREPKGRPDVRVDRAWAFLIRAMAEMAPNPHSFERGFGSALARTGYSEERFVRLLRAEDSDLAREVHSAGAWLARKGLSQVNWEHPAHLLFGPTGVMGIRTQFVIHTLARDYFRAQADHS